MNICLCFEYIFISLGKAARSILLIIQCPGLLYPGPVLVLGLSVEKGVWKPLNITMELHFCTYVAYHGDLLINAYNLYYL